MLEQAKKIYPVTVTNLQEVLVDSLNARKVSARLHLLTLIRYVSVGSESSARNII